MLMDVVRDRQILVHVVNNRQVHMDAMRERKAL